MLFSISFSRMFFNFTMLRLSQEFWSYLTQSSPVTLSWISRVERQWRQYGAITALSAIFSARGKAPKTHKTQKAFLRRYRTRSLFRRALQQGFGHLNTRFQICKFHTNGFVSDFVSLISIHENKTNRNSGFAWKFSS